MSDKTGIEWTDATWNPTKGCDRVSPGCDHCYAMTLAPRLKAMGSPAYQLDGDTRTSGPGFLSHEWPAVLDQPIRWTKPRRIFVNSMSDLFHDNISDDYIARVFAVMAIAQRHTFQVLTKRHARMRSLLSSPEFWRSVGPHMSEIVQARTQIDALRALPNVWLGVSVENQQWANIRIPALLDTPAAVRFLSCEPLLGPVDLHAADDGLWNHWLPDPAELDCDGAPESNPLCQAHGVPGCRQDPRCSFVDWVIVGGESGQGARPMSVDWARSLRDQCTEAGVPFLFKQWGAYDDWGRHLSKKLAGRVLDGRTWDEYPQTVTA